ncbi:hypothetical protein MA9V2_175 [Chryseobacterium phage MA9V-2]|nr:hypothetical protein MA9V2_175 [Chryseobacterium phage MA9V-2]
MNTVEVNLENEEMYGEPAHPVVIDKTTTSSYPGLTKLEHMSATILAGMLCSPRHDAIPMQQKISNAVDAAKALIKKCNSI